MSFANLRLSSAAHDDDSCQALDCGIASFGIANLDEEKLAAVRKSPATEVSMPLAPSVARHCDEQTIASLFAVGEAMRRMESTADEFSDWGIVASSRYLGRSFFSQSLAKFDREGPWNTSIQVVPHRSLHSPSSTISLALGCHGPNIGVGGGIDGEGQALLAAASVLKEHSVPGVWLVLAGWSPELNVNEEGEPTHAARCHALALALKPAAEVTDGMHLKIVPDLDAFQEPATSQAKGLAPSWLSLLTTLVSREQPSLNIIAPLCEGLRAEFAWHRSQAVASPHAHIPLRAAG